MIGKKIRELRREIGWKQRDLANALNVSRQAVGYWENEKREPDINMLKKLAFFLDSSVDELVGYDLYKKNMLNKQNNPEIH